MVIDVGSALILGATVLIMGFISDELSSRFGVPDVLLVMLMGILLGPILGVIPYMMLSNLAPYFASLTLAIILFESGLNFPLVKALTDAPGALLLALLSVSGSILIITPVTTFLLGLSILESALLGSIIGGTSSAIMVTAVNKISLNSKAKNLLTLESILTDAVVVVIAITIMRLLILPETVLTYSAIAREIAGSLFIGVVTGLLSALLFSKILRSIEDKLYNEVFTLGTVVLVYGLAEQLGGNGAISVFAFGMVLGNMNQLVDVVKTTAYLDRHEVSRKESTRFKPTDKRFYAQISFLMRTYFFALLGMLFYIPDTNRLLLSGGIVSLLLAARVVAVRVASLGMGLTSSDKNVMSLLCARGLSAAVLANLAINYQLPIANLIMDLTTQVIIYTVLITSFAPLLPKFFKNRRENLFYTRYYYPNTRRWKF